ncbi:MAG: tRNA-dihydrouridine synthase [Patescibacteria group bacterium]|nr:tRNA-dihydrouridine synthase [Patescibacteria group bacterium]MDD4304261.1 tRNA-dihydrouridine synthase [Patescibacteria group bacterium]MDD4695315.1 tRNA-dihydrouridine synthase [Patescibacteria group bacterium]
MPKIIKNYKTKNFWLSLRKPILALAPMAGITDSAYCTICRKNGADVVYTEMISADGLNYNSKKTGNMLKILKGEKPVVVQLFGKDPEKFVRATQIVTKLGFSGIDINFGCPAKKVAGHGGGATLMRDLNLCYKIIKSVCDNTDLPVSIKVRKSITANSCKIKKLKVESNKEIITSLDLIKKIKNLRISTIMIHSRTYEQGFSGEIDYNYIKNVRKHFKGIILANGNINTPEMAKKTLELTGADGIGIARGVYGKPWIFKQCKDYLETNKYKEKTWAQIKKIALTHAKLNFEIKSDYGIVEMRKHLLFYTKNQKFAKEMRRELVNVKTISEIKKVFDKY